jgi:hypothetical protein
MGEEIPAEVYVGCLIFPASMTKSIDGQAIGKAGDENGGCAFCMCSYTEVRWEDIDQPFAIHSNTVPRLGI